MLKILVLGIAIAFAPIAGAAVAQDTHPCALITPEEAEAALGAPLAAPPFAFNGAEPSAEGSICRIEDMDFRTIDISVAWRDGGEQFGALNLVGGIISDSAVAELLQLSEGATGVGEWDEARTIGCCEFAALRGETLVSIAFGAAKGGLTGAIGLANAALRRAESPPQFDAAGSLAAATAQEAKRPARRNACELVSAEKFKEITGAEQTMAPLGDEGSCTWTWDAGYEMEMTMRVTWRGGFAEHDAVLDAIGAAGSMLQSEGLDVDGGEADATFADVTSSSFIAEMAVENDVLLAIESGGFMADVAQGLVKAAAATIRGE